MALLRSPVVAREEFVDDSEYERVGCVLRRRPVPGLDHGKLQVYIANALRPEADKRGAEVSPEWSLSDGQGNWLTPDLMWAEAGFRLTERGHLLVPPPPRLVIEIRSVGQTIRELFDKIADYHAYGVPYYWIVDPTERACYEVLTTGREASIRVTPQSGKLAAGEIELSVPAMWNFLDGAA